MNSRDGVAPGERGSILVVTLWSVGLVAALLFAILGGARTEALVTRNAIALARAQLAAEGATEIALARLLSRRAEGRVTVSGDPEPWSDGEVSGRWALIDENGRIDLNEAPWDMLAGLVRAIGRDEAEAGALACRILAHRGSIDPRCPAPGFALDGRIFVAPGQLAALSGTDPDLLAALMPHVTVHSGAFGIDPGAATREALLAVPGHSPGLVDHFLARRAMRAAQGEDASVYDMLPPSRYLTASPGEVFTIHAEAVLPGGTVQRVERVVRLTGEPQRPWRTLAWRSQPPRRLPAPR
jgi:general secretion pathway protein K